MNIAFRTAMRHYMAIILLLLSLTVRAANPVYDIRSYQAVGDGKTVNTAAIQKAIDDCAAKGGGTVYVPAGTFVTGMIALKSNINLYLDANAVLYAAAQKPAYKSVVLIDKAAHVTISGSGTIFGNGEQFDLKESEYSRPYVVYAVDSKQVLIENVHLRQSASWTLRLFRCEGVIVKHVSIYSHANYNNDGIDIDSKDVVITGCMIDAGDDAICLKSEDKVTGCENVTVTNCIAASNCNLIKMGTGSVVGFKNISISNCVLRKASESPLHFWARDPKHYITDSVTGINGIALEIVDGGTMDQVTISNITMTGVQTPIFIRLGNRKNGAGVLKNVIISNVIASSCSRMSSTISGIPGSYIENVILRDIIINSVGGGTAADAQRPTPESIASYPENRMFGWTLPASGLYVRHARNISLENIQFNHAQPDERPAVWFDDAHNVRVRAIRTDANSKGDSIRQVNSTKLDIGDNYFYK